MKALTLRNIPPNVAQRLKTRAEEKGVSLNKAAISLLEETCGGTPDAGRKKRYTDLDHLFGTWSKERARAVYKNLMAMRKIDTEVWK